MNKVRMQTKDITMSFGEKKVLNQLNLSIREGEIFGLLGPSGAGKTTLIKLLTGQLRQSDGSAVVLGKDSCHLDSDAYRRIGMVLDNSGLYERLSCRDNLSLFAEIYGLSKRKISGVLERVGLAGEEKCLVGRFSKGMKQRLVLARAIMHEPEILFLDEPTSGLDPSTASSIHRLMQEEKERGTTIFLTTHNMDEASRLCDYVGLLYQGDLVEYGNPKEVCRRYNHQNQIKILLKNGEQVKIPNQRSSADLVSGYLREESLCSIHSTEPDLETVFIELTGRGLLDEKSSSNL